jgi:hypothetical protein
MPQIVILTDDGRETDRRQISGPGIWPGDHNLHAPNGVWAEVVGRLDAEPLGWLGRALRDAALLQDGQDPERPSEKAMRLAAERRAREEQA